MAMIGSLIKGGKTAIKLIGTATEVVTAAQALGVILGPEMEKLAESGALDAAKDGAGKAASGALHAVAEIPDAALTPVKKLFFDPIKGTLDANKIQKAVKDTQQALLLHANSKISAADFLKRREADREQGLTDFSGFSLPGCFVIATYAKFDFDKDLTDYLGIYIGKAMSIGNGIEETFSKRGNPDLYADMKYKQNIQIYLFTCREEELDTKYDLLLEALQSDRSYN